MALVSLQCVTERGVNVFDWPGNPIEEAWNIMKKKYFKLSNNNKKALE